MHSSITLANKCSVSWGKWEKLHPQQTAFRTEKDLLPFLTGLESVSGNAKPGSTPFSPDFLQGLNATARKIQQQIHTGVPVDLEFLGSQMTSGLKKFSNSKSSSSPDIQMLRIPFEERQVPLGESQRGSLQKLAIINEAITKNDIGMIREFAGDPAFLNLALPAEKAAFVDALSKHTIAPEITGPEKKLDFESMTQILQSAQTPQEFRSIVSDVGLNKIQNAFKEDPAEFNIIAHVFQSGELALDPTQSLFEGNEYMKGFTPQQIFAARKEGLGNVFENPLLLGIASPDEKGFMVRQLHTGYVSLQDNQSIMGILQSAMNKTEFDQIVNSAGGKSIALALQDPDSLLQWNRLAGAYDRMDLTTDFVEGVKNSGALLAPFQFEGNEPVSLFPLSVPSIFRDQPLGDVAKIFDTFIQDASNWMGSQVRTLERGVFVQAGLENFNRMMDGLPLLDLPLMRNQLHSILLQQPNVQSQFVLNHFQNLASTTGLNGPQLASLISQPLAFIYSAAANQGETLAQNVMAFFQEKLQLALFQFGPDTPQVKFVNGQIKHAQMTFLPFVEHLRSVSTLLSEAFPPSADFVTSVAEFASSFKKNFAQTLLPVFPQMSEMIHGIFENAQSMKKLINGTPQLDPSTSVPVITTEVISQLKTQLTTTLEGIEMIRNGSLSREISRVGQQLIQLPDIPRELIQLTKQTASFLDSIHDGSYAKVLKEIATQLKAYDDPIAELTKTTAREGAEFLTNLQDGTLSKRHEEFLRKLDNFQNGPGVAQINGSFEKLKSLTDGMLQGSAVNSDDAIALITNVATKEYRGFITNIVKAAEAFKDSPDFRKLIDLTEGGGKFLNSLRQGTFPQNVEMMNSRFGYTPAVAQIIERGLHLSTNSSNVLKAVVARDFERPIAQITKKAQAKTQAAKEIADVETIFTSAATTFYALTEVDHMDILWRYHQQLDLLNDKVLSDPSFNRFEKQFQLLSRNPDLKESLQNQFTLFQKTVSASSKS